MKNNFFFIHKNLIFINMKHDMKNINYLLYGQEL